MAPSDPTEGREPSPKKLSREDFAEARELVRSTARPIDVALFEYHFGDGTAASVLDELGEYQNPDGGFGRALEPDIRLDASSPHVTSTGLQYCTAVDADGDHPVVRRAVEYLVDAYESEGEYWPSTPPEVNDAPHAPWWHVETVEPPTEEEWPNPSAELVGYLHQFSSHASEDVLRRATERARENIAQSETVAGGDVFNLLCWQRALPHLPDELAETVRDAITATCERHALIDENVGATAVSVAPSPDSILARVDPEAVDESLDAVVEQQAPDGGWWPTWAWGQYEETWEVAKREWAGKRTVETLYVLDAHSRLP